MLLVERRHVVIVTRDEKQTSGYRLLGALARALGEQLGFINITPSYDPSQRPNFRMYSPNHPGRPYPPLLLIFLPDTTENRALLDALVIALGASAGLSISTFAERGPIVFIDEISEGAALVLNALQDLRRGAADDLSLN